jgi:hypothetical protein
MAEAIDTLVGPGRRALPVAHPYLASNGLSSG